MLRVLNYHIDNSMIHLFNVYYSALLPRSIFIVLSSNLNITCSFFKPFCYPSYSNQVQLSLLQHSQVETTPTKVFKHSKSLSQAVLIKVAENRLKVYPNRLMTTNAETNSSKKR